MTEFVEVVAARVAAECERQRADDDERRRENPYGGLRFPWSMRGSAGAAVGWLREIATENPSKAETALVLLLGERIGQALESSPRYYSPAHLRGVAAIALEAAVDRSPTVVRLRRAQEVLDVLNAPVDELHARLHVTTAPDMETVARLQNEGYESAMAQVLADDPGAADEWLERHDAELLTPFLRIAEALAATLAARAQPALPDSLDEWATVVALGRALGPHDQCSHTDLAAECWHTTGREDRGA